MLFLMTLFLSLLAIAADCVHFYRRRRRKNPASRTLIAWIVVTDALPVISSVISALSRDNGTGLMYVYMWLFWGWIITVLPRLAFYVFNFIHLRRTGYAVAGALVLFFLWGTTWGRTRIHVNRVEICSERIPEAFDGYRFVQITDTHVGTLVRSGRELTRLADSVNALRPDAVFFTGDLVNIRAEELDERVMALLRRIEGPVWSVTGNHDVGTYIKDSVRFPAADEAREVVARQRSMGWNVLEDTTVYLRRGADSISLTGLSFDPALRERRHDRDLPGTAIPSAYNGIPDSLYNITLVHIPQLWEQIVEAGYGDLTLVGHVHSMQFKIRPWGRGWSPAEWIYKHWSGRYDSGRHTLYVNDGTGYVAYPMRLGAWPEVTLFTLRCKTN
ncbi:metallophosphoesterase [Alistipes sp. kh20]|uniref:metallophosphoesterase n=1 Tax=Alistipes montrealensis TaxID=2834113 RepID=UPI001BCFC004|nr:metallophosphoesterase [Alistipes montrealensis]MBS4765892.1 metallophosphoesterase [Alistipes montrealensis]